LVARRFGQDSRNVFSQHGLREFTLAS